MEFGASARLRPPQLGRRLQSRQKARVGGGKAEALQFLSGNPPQIGTINSLRITLVKPAQEELQVHRFLGVGMSQAFEERPDTDFDSEFLPQFASEAALERFLGFTLASRELPQPSQMRFSVALCNQEPAVTENQGGGNIDDAGGHET
jgi:hypothetical protein